MSKSKKPATIHTVLNKDKKASKNEKWVNKQNGEVISAAHTKEVAEDLAAKEAKKQKTEHKIHNMDGTISGSNSYGNDPKDIKG